MFSYLHSVQAVGGLVSWVLMCLTEPDAQRVGWS